MMPIRLWYPVYDRNLAWMGIRLQIEPLKHNAYHALLTQISTDLDGIDGIRKKQFIVDAQTLLRNPAIPTELFPASQLTITLPETLLHSPRIVPLLQTWHDQHVSLAINELTLPASLPETLISTCILNAAAARTAHTEQKLSNACKTGKRLFADGIGAMELFQWCVENKFSYFTFAGLNYTPTDKPLDNPSSLPIMQLLALVASDAEIDQLEEVFKRDPKLAFELLKLVNSAAFGSHREISSFSQAIMILGRRHLQRWLQLLMYAKPNSNNRPNILMQRAAERGRLMEKLAEHHPESINSEHAFMVGVFSMLDVLLCTPSKNCSNPSVSPTVEAALLNQEGTLGSMLGLVSATENNTFTIIRRLIDELEIDSNQLSQSQLEAICWALKVTRGR